MTESLVVTVVMKAQGVHSGSCQGYDRDPNLYRDSDNTKQHTFTVRQKQIVNCNFVVWLES